MFFEDALIYVGIQTKHKIPPVISIETRDAMLGNAVIWAVIC